MTAMSTHENYFNFFKMAHECGGCTLDQLKQAVKENFITADEYKTICGQDYVE